MKTRAATRRHSRARAAAHPIRRGSTRTSRTARRSATGRSAGSRGRSATLTTDHEEIQRWVEERGGHPATVRGTIKNKDAAGILRIDFPGFSGARSLKAISWGEWFDIFDERRLGFLRQNRTAGGKLSRFNKLVCRK